MPRVPIKRGCLALVIGLAAVIAVVPFQTIIWDGGFPDAEYRLTFLAPDGRPVEGVTLQVLTKAGGVCYGYPVNEFIPDEAPVSDRDGRMTFHHVDAGIEFGGHEHSNLLGFRFGDTDVPQYDCVFMHEGREVHRTRFNTLRPRGDWFYQLPTVTRVWKQPEGLLRTFELHQDEWEDYCRRLFDCNGDGQFDREERVARRYFERYALRPPRESPEIQFRVVERTITISVP